MFGAPMFLGPCHQFVGYFARLSHVGTGQVDLKDSIECRPGLFPVDPGPLAKLHCACGRLLRFGRGPAFDRYQCEEGCVSEVQLQLGALVIIGELLQQFEPGLELRDRFGVRPAVAHCRTARRQYSTPLPGLPLRA